MREAHIRFFVSCLETGFPEQFVSLDTSRLTAVYFAVLGLDMLGALDQIDKRAVVSYILAMQIPADRTGKRPGHCGFIGSTFLGQIFTPGGTGGECSFCGDGSSNRNSTRNSSSSSSSSGSSGSTSGMGTLEFCQPSSSPSEAAVEESSADRFMQGHLAMTYTSLAVLATLDGDTLTERVDRASLVSGMRHLQQPEGSFRATLDGSECDMRFLYCACAISSMLGDWSGVDVERAVGFVRSCITYEGGISLVPGAEAHGGSCYTAVASLVLMGRLDEVLGSSEKAALQAWLEQRICLEGGYNGRTNKETDSCYSFWVGATLQLLGAFDDCDHGPTRSFLLQHCQARRHGGFKKTPEHHQDVLHSFYSLCWLSMSGGGLGLRPIDVRLAVCSDRLVEVKTHAHHVVFEVVAAQAK